MFDGDGHVQESRAAAGVLSILRVGDPVVLALLFAFWAFCNPYYTIDASTIVYSARAIADLDPAGVGADIMFRNDGQSSFTLFTPIFGALVGAVGVSAATTGVALAAVVAGFVGAACAAYAIGAGKARNLAVIFAAALPSAYGGYRLFSYAETAATPRPFAEMFVLGALSALVARRIGLAALLMVAAAAIHPIMAAPGAGVLLLWIALERGPRRVLVVLALGAVGALLLRPDLIARLWTFVDPEWRAVLIERNPHLFPSLWLDDWLGRAAVRSASLIIGASVAPPRVARLFILTLVVGVVGVGAAYVLGDKLSSLIVLQAQSWRSLWLVGALGGAAAAICAVDLWPRGGGARIALMLLALAWADADYDWAAIALSLSALAVYFGVARQPNVLSTVSVDWAVGLVSAVLVVSLANRQIAMFDVVAGAPVDHLNDARRTLGLPFDYTPLAFLAAVFALANTPGLSRQAMEAFAGAGFLVLFGVWDQRSVENKYFDSGAGVPDLLRRIEERPGDVYWLDGLRESWWWLHRPNWLSPIQGAGLVFSRELAFLYRDRAQRAIDAGLSSDEILTPFREAGFHKINVSPEKLTAFCAAADAPAWIVAPVFDGFERPTGLDAAIEWRAPVQKLVVRDIEGVRQWRRVANYLVAPCRAGGDKYRAGRG